MHRGLTLESVHYYCMTGWAIWFKGDSIGQSAARDSTEHENSIIV